MGIFRDNWGEIRTGWIIAFAFFIFIGFMTLIIVGAYAMDKKTCKENAEVMGLDYKYSIWTECHVEMENGRFIPLDNYNSFIDNTNKNDAVQKGGEQC